RELVGAVRADGESAESERGICERVRDHGGVVAGWQLSLELAGAHLAEDLRTSAQRVGERHGGSLGRRVTVAGQQHLHLYPLRLLRKLDGPTQGLRELRRAVGALERADAFEAALSLGC